MLEDIETVRNMLEDITAKNSLIVMFLSTLNHNKLSWEIKIIYKYVPVATLYLGKII
jgi:hypothetical protein